MQKHPIVMSMIQPQSIPKPKDIHISSCMSKTVKSQGGQDEKQQLTAKETIAAERARNPYFAMPSERPTKVLAIPNITLHSKAQTKTPPAPNRNK